MKHRDEEHHGHDRHRPSGHKRISCGIKRIIRGIADKFSISRGTVLAGFVVGFIFAPLLTAIVFVAAWFWIDDPKRFETRISGAADKARQAYEWTFGSWVPKLTARADEIMAEPVPGFPALRRAFDRLEPRTAKVEDYVSSDEYRLHREFRNMGDARR